MLYTYQFNAQLRLMSESCYSTQLPAIHRIMIVPLSKYKVNFFTGGFAIMLMKIFNAISS